MQNVEKVSNVLNALEKAYKKVVALKATEKVIHSRVLCEKAIKLQIKIANEHKSNLAKLWENNIFFA